MRKLKLILAAAALILGAGQLWAQKDVTSQYITNATLSSLNGWTNVNFNTPQKGTNTTGYASEAYAGWGSLTMTNYSLTQTITLPAGHYTLVNYSFYRYGLNADTDPSLSYAYLKAGSQQVAVKTLGSITAAGYANSQAEGANAFDSKMYRNTLDFTIDTDNTEIEIGLVGTHELKQSWMICGMFELINNDIAATMDAPFDVTGYITNPGFEYRDMTGWIQSPEAYMKAHDGNQAFKVGGWFAEKWQQSGALPAGSMSQTLTNLPAGYYKLTANLGGNGTYINLNGKTASWEADKDYTVGYVLAENEDLTITAGKTAEGTANWIHFDNFRLQFCGDVAAALTTLCAEVTNYESKLSASDYSTLLSAVNGYNKAYSDVDELLAAIDAVQALYDAADLYVEYTTALAAASAINQETPMNGDVLSALQTAIATTVTMSSSAAEAVAATNALNTATANATASIANYAEAKAILDAASTYDEAGKASYAADETVAAIQTAYNERSLTAVTADQKTAAQAALAAACKAQTQPADGCDMTAIIQNWDFLNCAKDNFPGWTIEKTAGNAQAFGSTAAEYWVSSAVNGGFDFYQSVTDLPIGVYTVQAMMWNSTDNESGAAGVNGECGVYGKSSSADEFAGVTADTRDDGKATYITEEIFVIDGTLRLGVKNNATMGGRWFGVDWVKLTYVRQLTAEEEEVIAKETAQNIYNEALAAAQAIAEGTIPATAYANLQTVISENTLADGTSSEYNDAAAALNEAVAAAQPLVTPYAAWKTLKAYADALVAVANDNATANSTLATAISDQNTAVEAATAVVDIETATSTLKSAMVTYASVANPKGDGAKFDLTFMLTNPDLTKFWDGTWWIQPEGWYKDQAEGNFQVMSNNSVNAEDGIHTVFMEYYYLNNNKTYDNGLFNIYTKATLPAGTYTMSCYAFAKEENYSSGAANPQVYFYANDTQGSLVSSNKLTEQSISFVNDAEREVKIGLKPLEGNTYNWMGIGYVELYKVPAQVYEISEDVDYNTTLEGAGDVTLTRTIAKDKWNTIWLPFSLTNEELKAAFGADVEVATFSEIANAEIDGQSTISFNTMETPAISPNVPVLLKTSTSGSEYEFEGRTLVAGTPKVEGTNFDFVGTTAASFTIAEDDYFIKDDQLYQSTGISTIKGTRAYLKGKTDGARIMHFFIDGGETTGIQNVQTGTITLGKVYNLNGQEVKKAQKGVFIQNGKKIVLK